MQHCSGAY